MATISFAGLASGIDSTALIQAQSDASRKQKVEPYEAKVTNLTDTNEKAEEFRTKLTDLRTKVNLFSTLQGGGLSKQTSSSDDLIITATAANSASNGSYTVNVSQKAKNAVYSFNDRFPTPTTAINAAMNDGAAAAARTLTVTIGQGSGQEAVNLVLTSTTTATDVVNQFNATSAKGQASLVNVGTSASPSYAIMVTSNKEGLTDGFVSVSTGASVGALGTGTTDQAANATFTVSGVTGSISRPTNTVADVIPGLTLSIVGTGSSSVVVGDDVSATTTKVQDFVESFNELVVFMKENNTITREDDGKNNVKNIFAPLASTRADDNAMQAVRDALGAALASTGSEIRIFPDLGLTTERDGTLKFDTNVFNNAMAKEPTSVNNLLKNFADKTSTTGGTIDLITRFNGILDITTNSNKGQIEDFNKRISDAEASILKTEADMKARFARLESLMSRLQGQQSQLTSALASLR